MNAHYAYRVDWSPEDGEYVGRVLEFPSLSWLDEDPAAALQGIIGVVTEVVEDLRASGEPVPEPLADKSYTGKFALRMSPALHRKLALEAADQGISMNKLLNDKLACA